MVDDVATSPTVTTALVSPAGHAPPVHGCMLLHDAPDGYSGDGGTDGGGGSGRGGDGGDGGGGDGEAGATLSSPSTSSSACPPLEHTSIVDITAVSPAGISALVDLAEHTPPVHGCMVLQDEPGGYVGDGGGDGDGGSGGGGDGGDGGGGDGEAGATLSSPSTSSSACPPLEHTSIVDITAVSPAGISALVDLAEHTPPVHGCMVLQDEPGGYVGDGGGDGDGGSGGGGDGGDGGGGDGEAGATLNSPSTSSSACPPPEHTSMVDATTTSPAGTTALVAPAGHVPPAHGCMLLQVESWYSGDGGGDGGGGGSCGVGDGSDGAGEGAPNGACADGGGDGSGGAGDGGGGGGGDGSGEGDGKDGEGSEAGGGGGSGGGIVKPSMTMSRAPARYMNCASMFGVERVVRHTL